MLIVSDAHAYSIDAPTYIHIGYTGVATPSSLPFAGRYAFEMSYVALVSMDIQPAGGVTQISGHASVLTDL